MEAGADIRSGPFPLPAVIMISPRSVLAVALHLYDR